MKTRCATAVCIAALLCVAGCSNDPTSDQFKTFAEDYATKISGEKISDAGAKRTIKAELVRHNLEKTNSLTVPFVGTAEYKTEISGLTFRHYKIKGYETPAICFNKVVVSFGWVDGKWEPQDGTAEITAVATPALSVEQLAEVGSIYNEGNRTELARENIANGKVWTLSRNLTMTMEEFKEGYKIKD